MGKRGTTIPLKRLSVKKSCVGTDVVVPNTLLAYIPSGARTGTGIKLTGETVVFPAPLAEYLAGVISECVTI